MTIDLVPRLRPPTFATPPDGLQKVTVVKEYPDCFKIDVPISEGTKNLADLSKIIWYALWDLVGSASFATCSDFKIRFNLGSRGGRLPELFRELAIEGDPGNCNLLTISRAWWYQHYPIFSYPDSKESFPVYVDEKIHSGTSAISSTKRLQSEMPPPTHTVYQRYIAHLDSYFCLSIFGDSASELDLLHGWLNDPRVDQYWKDAGDREFHVNWLRERYNDAHILPMLGSYRGTNGADQSAIEPFAYYEVYWAADDKISKAYPTEPYDRGIHMLVGSSFHRGAHRVRSWLPSLIHFIFTDDSRTRRILSEPDHRNKKMISYLQKFGFKKLKLCDMGHKTAAIMVLEREDFWSNCPL